MKTKEEVRQHLMQYKFKPNPNHFIIVDKWNDRIYKTHKHEIFDYISEYIDEMIIEMCHNKNKIFEFDVDNNEHMWYNEFNKWNWTTFENGVINIADNDNR